MDDGDGGFSVLIKPSAMEANEAVAEYADRYGREVRFDSRSAAADLAELFSGNGDGTVVIQGAAPQDERDVDAYLVPKPDRRVRTPAGSIETELTFDVSAAQFGALGEALVLSYEENPPVLEHYVRRDLGRASDEPLHVLVESDPSPITATRVEDGGSIEWRPDCRAIATEVPDGRTLREYLCEIKTGGGSLQRDQLPVMRAAARRSSVLALRFDVADLPESYTVRIDEIEPDSSGDVSLGDDSTIETDLDDFR